MLDRDVQCLIDYPKNGHRIAARWAQNAKTYWD
jgi:hypothetical protein